MVITKWNNEIQEAVMQEWTEGCQEAKGRQALRVLRLRIAEKYGLNMHVVRGIIELAATQGMIQNPGEYGKTYEPINYHELVGDLKERTRTLERKFGYLLDGVEKVLQDGETMGIHIANLRQMGKWMKKRDTLDMEEITQAPPELPDESREVELPSREVKDLSPMEKIDKLRGQADRAHERGKLLFREINEGKAGDPR